MLSDEEYLEAIRLSRYVVEAHDSLDGGATIAGSFLGQLKRVLNGEVRAASNDET